MRTDNARMAASDYSALVDGLTFAGPDQGIDFTGRGRILAPVDIKITRVAGPDRPDHTTWPGGHVIVGEILNPRWARELGHGYGHFMYFAEAVEPVHTIHVGAVIRKGHEVALLNSSYPGCEIGHAQNSYGMPFGTPHDGKPGGPTPVHGLAIEHWIRQLSAIKNRSH